MRIESTQAALAGLVFVLAATPAAHAAPASPATGGAAHPTASPATPASGPATAPGTDAAARAARLERRLRALEKRIKELESTQDDSTVKHMITESKVDSLTPEKQGYRLKAFTGHARSLQGLNPELSLTGDFGGTFRWSNGKEYGGGERSGFWFRTLGLHFQAALDPFSYMKAAVEISPGGVELGEAYMVWTSVLGVMNITAGKFRQQLGVVNRWHKHALDQYDFPLMLQMPFGEDGLNQIGLSFQFLIKHFIAHANELTVQVTNGMNSNAFEGGFYSLPTTLVHFKNYWDLNRSTYLELGLTGIAGFNHHRGDSSTDPVYSDNQHTQLFQLYDGEGNPLALPFAPAGKVVDEGLRVTAFGGADLTIQWEPVNQAKYRNVIWRTEFLYGYKQLPRDTTGAKQAIHWMGGYSYLQAKVSRQIEIGVRGDLVQEFAVDNGKSYRYQVAPYLTWWQSPWARIRLEYNYVDGNLIPPTHRAIVQVVFAAGPHKHDRY